MPGQVAERIRALNAALMRPLASGLAPGARDGAAVEGSRFTAFFTTSRTEIMRAQRLRYRVFSEEYGAKMRSPFGLDRDHFDRHCLHLVVRDNDNGELVGYTRVLPVERVHRTGGFYSAGEFDLGMLAHLDGRIVEIGRTCIHPAHRGGAVIGVLWSRLARYLCEQDIRYLIGCASVPLSGTATLGAILRRIRENHLAPPELRVTPRVPVPEHLSGDVAGLETLSMPPLLKAYLRMGARICGEPCLDADFNCVDFFVLLAREELPRRYVQHFMSPALAS